jgi:glucose-1-phosphate adenylyltransferase
MPTPARAPRLLAVVLAGGAGSRLGPLTAHRAKPAVPFAGMFRLIDVALSNVANSGLTDVWVIEQFEPHALNDHLANGRPWDLDRTHGGLLILPPYQRRDDGDGKGDGDAALAEGNADALVRQRHAIEQFAPDVVFTLSADHLYRLDLRDVLATHREAGAGLTIVTTDPPADDDPTRFAWVSVDGDGTVVDFAYKPDRPDGDRICTEVFAFDGPLLVERLAALAEDTAGGSAGDYGDRLVPELVAKGRVVEHRLEGYWRDVGTIGAFHRAHRELVAADPPLVLDDPGWPFLTGSISAGPARVARTARVSESLLSPGVDVAGTVEGSVLGRDTVVEEGAVVRRSVVLDRAIVRSGAEVVDAIVDVGVTVAPGDAGERDDSGVVIHAGPG